MNTAAQTREYVNKKRKEKRHLKVVLSTMNSDCHSKPPMFFKIILEDTITQGRLEIPSGFVREFGNCLSNPITLKVPNGKTWQVEMSKVGEEVWLAKGWVEFSEHHSFQKGHLLVFKYEGNSHFNVLIFDTSATEIEYPGNKPGQPCKDNREITDLVSDLSIQDLGGNVASSSEVVTSATNFTSNNPWFKIVLKSSGYLRVPFNFMKEHMECETKTVMLKVEDKSWPVKFHVYLNSSVAALYDGVASFLRDNSLKQGDVCVFELISNDAFNVSIFRT